MNTCFKCGRKVDEKHRELYGILKWENTSGSDIIDSGTTAYAAYKGRNSTGQIIAVYGVN